MQPNFTFPSKEELTENLRITGQFGARDYQLSEINILRNGVNVNRGSRLQETTLLGESECSGRNYTNPQCGRMLERRHQKRAIILLQKKRARKKW